MKYQKVLSIISFILVLLALLTAFITDFVLFKDAILTFIGGIIASVFIFVIMLFAMIVSIIMIFGIFLLENYGFWPLSVTLDAFRDILNDIVITQEQVSTFVAIRIILTVICVSTLIMSVVAKHKVEGQKKVPLKGMSIVAFVFSILGLISALSLITIASFTF